MCYEHNMLMAKNLQNKVLTEGKLANFVLPIAHISVKLPWSFYV